MSLALDDVRVIEYGNFISAPYCSKLMADLGADVIKIEKPGVGDLSRERGPFLDDIPGPDRSGIFLYLNANKRGITLNPEKATGKEIFQRLIKDADILIEDTRPGTLDSLGLGYGALKAINPRLVMTSITPFGQTGPYKEYKGSDLIMWQMGGLGYATPIHTGTPDYEPLRVMHMASYLAGATASSAAMTALYYQRLTGIGQHVDVSQLEAVFLNWGWYYWPYEHKNSTRVSKFPLAPVGFLKCRDGWVFIVAHEDHHWKVLLEMMGNPDWAGSELFKDRFTRADNWEDLEPLLLDWSMKYTKAEITEMGKARGIPVGPVNSIADVLDSEQLKYREYFVEREHPKAGTLTYPGAPYKLPQTPWSVRSPAPLLGQYNEEIYCRQLGYTKGDLVKMYEVGII